MKIDATTEKGFKRIVNFELEESELDKHRKSAFNKIRKTAKIDGFRPGKAPESLIKKRYGASIESDALTEAANGLIREYLVENKIYPLSEPVINSVNNEGDILKLNVSFEIYPEFELGDFTGLTVEKEKFTITDKDIEEEIAQLLEKHSSSKEVSEPVSDGHIVEVSIKQAGLE
ncbi:MAG: trigger factor family protein, partial [Candidatus Delongbacteria bacterium]